MTRSDEQPVDLFWTGGWDSTFRLLQLLLVERRIVQPYYVIDPERRSTSSELTAMREIEERVFSTWPETHDRLLASKHIALEEIPADETISSSFSRLREQKYVGSQYEWLARFASTFGDNSIELCMMRPEGGEFNGEAGGALMKFESDGQGYRLSPELLTTDLGAIFRYFRYPVAHLSKRDMEDIAVREGFRDVLDLTWFCYRPRRNGTPCGCCRTCRVVAESKLGKRLPLISRLRYCISITPRFRDFVLCHDQTYLLGRKLKQLRRK